MRKFVRLVGLGLVIVIFGYRLFSWNLDFGFLSLIMGGGLFYASFLRKNEEGRVTVKSRYSFREVFWLLVEHYDLGCKVELNKVGTPGDWSDFTLFRIIWREEDRYRSLPQEFVEQMRQAIYACYGRPGKEIKFRLAPGKTMEEIERSKQHWIQYCRQYNGD